jgi:RNA polymerase sigma-70 factor (ECF subfamily)
MAEQVGPESEVERTLGTLATLNPAYALDHAPQPEAPPPITIDDLYRSHRMQMVRMAILLVDDMASAEDVVQEAFVVLPDAARRYRGAPDGLESFLLGIAVKRARRHQRAAWRRRLAMDRLAAEDTRAARTPEQDVYRRELGVRLARALGRLPHAQRVAFVLCEIEGMTSGQAAVVADAPEPTMRTRLFHARRRLRELLAEEGAE